ncbi:MAG: CSLREA domain-containing protein, partial [Gemmatimonadales bacterium]
MRRFLLVSLAAPSPRCAAFFMALPLFFATSASAQTTLTVNTSNDLDDGVCDASHCSLREAISAANNAGGGLIAFDIPGPGPHTIKPSSELPALVSDVTIDGTTEPDFAGTPVVELDGSITPAMTQGLVVVGSGNVIRGIVV